ncbi:hypothetical protein ACH47Z_05310 [Streptomyces sp. NPDC020192]|uniref:hypothetical protein n=1 Tax=Streptomyces sp. NPDC020192 TaxID=3365066 RepID=UPI0037A4F2E3
MAWRDRFRRRAAARAAGPGSSAGTSASGTAVGPSVPGDWDGGWRRTAPPTLTVARAPLGVSDGLTFRAGLASWQNPSFDAGLGHALLPSAPMGLVQGVTRPAVPGGTYADGGPLLLRVLRADVEGDEGAVESGAAAASHPAVARRTGGRGGSGSARRGAGESAVPGETPIVNDLPAPGSMENHVGNKAEGTRTSLPSPGRSGPTPAADTPAVQRSVAAPDTPVQRAQTGGGTAGVVRPDDPGRPAPGPEIPVVRRIAVVPNTSGDSAAPGTPSGPRTAAKAGRTARREQSVNNPVRPRAVGPSPTVARRIAAPVRRITALRPAVRHTEAAAPPVVGEDAQPAPTAPRATTPARPGTRPPLGAPMTELPPTAQPLSTNAPDNPRPAPGPTLPVAQRQMDVSASAASTSDAYGRGPATPRSEGKPTVTQAVPEPSPQPSGARARSGLGAPLPALPPTADVQRSPRPGGRPHTPPDPATATVQRAAPEPPAGTAPLLGTTDTERRSTSPHSPAVQGHSPSTPGTASAPAPPLLTPGTPRSAPVQRVLAPAGTGAAATPSSASRATTPALTGAGGAPPLVVARPLTVPAPGRTPDATDNRALHPGTAQRLPTPRSLSLLSARTLTLNTRVPEGVTPPAAAHITERPVVTASWRREPSPSQEPAPSPPGAPQVQRTVSTRAPMPAPSSYNTPSADGGSARPRRAVPVVRPSPPVQRATAGHLPTLPVTDPQAPPIQGRPPAPAQPSPPVPVVRATRTTAGTPHRTPGPTAPVAQQDATGGTRTVQRTPAPAPAPRKPPDKGTVRSPGHPQDPGVDLDELARRLLEPMARLLRADLRRGRERAGRPYDGRR